MSKFSSPLLGHASRTIPSSSPTRALMLIVSTLALMLFVSPFLHSTPFTLPTRIPFASRTGVAPLWHDFARIKRHARPSSGGVVAPLPLRHLLEFNVAEPFREVYLTSAWLDTRPLLVKRDPSLPPAAPQVAIIASLLGAPHMQMPSGFFDINPLQCHIVLKKGRSQSTFVVSASTLGGLPDPHEYEKQFVSAIFNCPLEGMNGEKYDWEGAEIFVTLSLPTIPPPSDVFLPVTHLPILDPEQHRTGEGSAAVSLPPMTGDIYAPFMADYVAFYMALGFDHFYIYLVDPGPKALEALRDLVKAYPDAIEPIRWGVHQGWKYSAVYDQRPSNNLLVDPSEWNLPGIEQLDGDAEFELGGLGSGENDVRLWYFGQSAAQADCQFRAMAAGRRWLFAGDWDELLLLRPADGGVWPPPATTARSSPFLEWARTVEKRWSWPETLGFDESQKMGVSVEGLTKGMLPASFEFQSSFACIRCSPSREDGPLRTSVVERLEQRFPGLDWNKPGSGLPYVLASPVRMSNWFPAAYRSKAASDPWAWWSLGIHFPGIGYTNWATTRGFCSPSAFANSADLRNTPTAACAADLVRSLGRNTVIVDVPEASSRNSPAEPKTYGTGAMIHLRVDMKLSNSLSRFNLEAQDDSLDLFTGEESVGVLQSHRVTDWASQYAGGEPAVLVEDWGLLEVMGNVLEEVMVAKAKYGPKKWIGKTGRSGRRQWKTSKKTVWGVAATLAWSASAWALWRVCRSPSKH